MWYRIIGFVLIFLGVAGCVVSEHFPIYNNTPIFRWDGKYFGFIQNNYLFNTNGKYLGWTEQGKVWKANGDFLGEIIENNYILRKRIMMEPMPKIPKIPPDFSISPIPVLDRIGKILKIEWVDALDEF